MRPDQPKAHAERPENRCITGGKASSTLRQEGTGWKACATSDRSHSNSTDPKACGTQSAGYGAVELDGFQPVDPWNALELTKTRRNLPHLQTSGSTYFVTFRCRDGLFLTEPAKDIVMAAIQHWNGVRIDIDAAVMMPDHVHLIFRILGDLSLSAVLQSIKGYSARSINRLLARKGPFWMDESFDHVIRHGQELEDKIEYIRQNPVTRGLVADWRDYQWLWIKE